MREKFIFRVNPVLQLGRENKFKPLQLQNSSYAWVVGKYFSRKIINKKYWNPLFAGRRLINNRKKPCGPERIFGNNYMFYHSKGFCRLFSGSNFNKKHHDSEKWLTSFMNRKPSPKTILRLPIIQKTQSKLVRSR